MLSRLVPCSAGLIYEYEKGRRQPGAENLKGLAQGCKVSSDYLLGIDNGAEVQAASTD